MLSWGYKEPDSRALKEPEVINGKRVVVVMPAYNAARTLEKTVRDLPDIVDTTIVVDDKSADHTVQIARALGLLVFVHDKNYGYGRNQQTCYREALAAGADIVVMVHPDYQYTPKLVTAMASMIAFGVYDVVLGSRILGGGALKGGMPFYKYISNRILTAIPEHFHRGEIVRISHRLPGVCEGSVDDTAAARKFRRFRVRQ